jgi:hypothetical protein
MSNIKWAPKLPAHIQNSIEGDQGDYDYDAHGTASDEEFTDEQLESFITGEELQDPTSHNEGVISEALKRIEQASLYQTLINHSLFSPNSARPEIMHQVEQEIKSFAVERLEILLGMKEESQKFKAPQYDQFTLEEANALKSIAARLLQKTEAPVERTPSVNPISQAPATKPALTQVQAPATSARIATKPAPVVAKPIAPAQQPKAKPAPRTRKSGSEKDPTRNYAQAGNPSALVMPRDLVMNQPNSQAGINVGGVNLSSAVLDALKQK